MSALSWYFVICGFLVIVLGWLKRMDLLNKPLLHAPLALYRRYTDALNMSGEWLAHGTSTIAWRHALAANPALQTLYDEQHARDIRISFAPAPEEQNFRSFVQQQQQRQQLEEQDEA